MTKEQLHEIYLEKLRSARMIKDQFESKDPIKHTDTIFSLKFEIGLLCEFLRDIDKLD